MHSQHIVLDPGHGGVERVGRSTPFGVRGPGGALEKDVTLTVARHVAARLGGRAVLTRDDDRNLSLRDRIGIAVRLGARAFVSLHAGHGRGAPSVWIHDRADTSSRQLARVLADRVGDGHVYAGDLATLDPALFGGSTAACLIELGDLSQRDTEQWLRYGAGAAQVAERIAAGLDSQIQWDQITQLRTGMVVDVQVRASGVVEAISHAYPLDVNGRLRMPYLGLVDADGLTLQQLAATIQTRLVNESFLRFPTVNVTLKHTVVAYGALVTADRLYVRLLDLGGEVQAESGWYPVRNDGTLNLPYVGVVNVRGRRLDEVEAEIEAGFQRDYIRNAVCHVTTQDLDASYGQRLDPHAEALMLAPR